MDERKNGLGEDPAAVHYGDNLTEKIKAKRAARELDNFEKFVLDQGYRYSTKVALEAAFERRWKAQHSILLTAEEFEAEAGNGRRPPKKLREVYDVLTAHIQAEHLEKSALLDYAHFGWCLKSPEAIIAYQTDVGKGTPISRKWAVNNCSAVISEESARLCICEEFGFEASRVRIRGTAFYDASDWNFIRFDCRAWSWLMHNGEIKQVLQG